jgi:hypothetical protein
MIERNYPGKTQATSVCGAKDAVAAVLQQNFSLTNRSRRFQISSHYGKIALPQLHDL